MTLTELYDELDKHDWFYAMSDDHTVYSRGRRDETRLRGLAQSIEGGKQLMADFAAHHFSGKPWKTEKQPKPIRPTT